MLRMTGLSKSFRDRWIFENVNLFVSPNEHVGLYGPPDSGKTTLLRLILGMEDWQDGRIRIRPATWFGYLPQYAIRSASYSVGDVLQAATEDYFASSGGWQGYQGNQFDVGSIEQDVAQLRQDVVNGLELRYVAPKYALKDLGYDEQRRVWLASVLIAQPDVMVLDEPAQGLSESAREWLVSFLTEYSGAMIVASADRVFLDSVTDKAWDILPEYRTVVQYHRVQLPKVAADAAIPGIGQDVRVG